MFIYHNTVVETELGIWRYIFLSRYIPTKIISILIKRYVLQTNALWCLKFITLIQLYITFTKRCPKTVISTKNHTHNRTVIFLFAVDHRSYLSFSTILYTVVSWAVVLCFEDFKVVTSRNFLEISLSYILSNYDFYLIDG